MIKRSRRDLSHLFLLHHAELKATLKQKKVNSLNINVIFFSINSPLSILLPCNQAKFKAEKGSWVYLALLYACYIWISQPYCFLQFKQHLSVASLWCLFLGHAGFFMHHELGFQNHFFSSTLQTRSVFRVTGLHSSFPLGVPLSVLLFFITRNERTLKLFNIFKSLHPFVSFYKRNAFLGILLQTPNFFSFFFF